MGKFGENGVFRTQIRGAREVREYMQDGHAPMLTSVNDMLAREDSAATGLPTITQPAHPDGGPPREPTVRKPWDTMKRSGLHHSPADRGDGEKSAARYSIGVTGGFPTVGSRATALSGGRVGG